MPEALISQSRGTSGFAAPEPIISFEVFPPRPQDPVDIVYQTVEALRELQPRYISVTYTDQRRGQADTLEVADTIQQDYGIESVVHLTCLNLTRAGAKTILAEIEQRGIQNLLALRGDLPQTLGRAAPETTEAKRDFDYASDLVRFIRGRSQARILAACYPEGHLESASLEEDLRHLKYKVDQGVDLLLTQLFLDNSYYYRFLERASQSNIQVPIQPGVMPFVRVRQVERMVRINGIQIPPQYQQLLQRYAPSPRDFAQASTEYALEQILELLQQGAPGIHLYTMNNPAVAQQVCEALR